MRNRLVITVAALLAAGALLASAVPASAAPASGGSVGFGLVRLDGIQEVNAAGQPAGDQDGRGTFGYVAFDSKLCYFLTARRIATPAAAHIHKAPRGVNGGIAVFLTTPADGFSAECITAEQDESLNTPMVMVQSELDAIIATPEAFYANVHNAEFPAGAIRGQLR